MIYVIVDSLRETLQSRGIFGYFRVLTFEEFRAIAAMLFSFLFVLLMGPRTIRWLIKQKIGDNPEFHNAKLNELMKDKRHTPTMGGILISGAIMLSTLLLADVRSFYVQMALVCLVWLSVLGAFDDWLKLTSAQRNPGQRDGLKSWEKLVFQFGLAVVLGLFIHHYGVSKFSIEDPDILQMSRTLTLPFMKAWTYQNGSWIPAEASNLIILNEWQFVILSILVITGASNAVNLTDGMDGLASGITGIVGLSFVILALIAGTEAWAKFLLVPYIPLSGELAVVAGSMVGACLGFLWWNCAPAKMFMGDTGSLPLGGLLGYMAVVIRQEFLLLIIGGIFVLEAVSVILQVGSYKLRGGKRIFRMAPIHHHFHLAGWTDQQVVVRFWVITVILAAIGLASIKLR